MYHISLSASRSLCPCTALNPTLLRVDPLPMGDQWVLHTAVCGTKYATVLQRLVHTGENLVLFYSLLVFSRRASNIPPPKSCYITCLLYTSDAADD